MANRQTIASVKLATIAKRLIDSAEIRYAAAGMASDDGYCDFFVENGGNGKPFHEKCPTILADIELTVDKFSDDRMSLKTRDADGGYCDFFVENGGNGKPFHEQCPTFLAVELQENPVARAIALSRTQVIQTLLYVTASIS